MRINFDLGTDVECQERKRLKDRVVRIDCFIDYRWNNVVPLRRLVIMRHAIQSVTFDFGWTRRLHHYHGFGMYILKLPSRDKSMLLRSRDF